MPENRYWFYAAQVRQILAALDNGVTGIEISVDLNRSVRHFVLAADALILDGANRLRRDDLQLIAGKENRIFLLQDGQLDVLEDRVHGYYKLVPTDQAPLLEISGVKMHISKGINPFDSAGQMAAQVVKRGDRVLDTCSGLGYAATVALQLGARSVLTVEHSATVMALRARNPWSQGLNAAGMEQVHADVGEYIKGLPAAAFDAVIHDPPRFSLAGELYGEAFYQEIFRVLKRRGALFHYTGNPHLLKQGSGFVDNAVKRLRAAGFDKVVKVPVLMGLTAQK